MTWDTQPVPDMVSEITKAPEPLYRLREQVIRTPRVGGYGQLAGTATTMYTAPSPTNTPTGTDYATSLVFSITLCNTDSSARTYTLYRIESGGSAAANRQITAAVSLAVGETAIIEWDKGLPLHAGDFISGLASSASKITYVVAVEELTH